MTDKKTKVQTDPRIDSSELDNNDSTIYNTNEKMSAIDLEIQDIDGVGPTTAKKLKEAGIVSVMDLAVTSAEQLAVDINSSKDSAASIHYGSTETA